MPRVVCPAWNCGRAYRVDESTIGRKVACKNCGLEFTAEVSGATGESLRLPTAEVAPASSNSGVAGQSTQPSTGDSTKPHFAAPSHIGRFELRGKLGQGAFGAVFRAHDPQLDREVAVKVPQAGLLDSPAMVSRFLREAKAAARLNHPHIVPVYDAGQQGDQHYIASAFIDGETLSEKIESYRGRYRAIAELVAKLAEALHYAHCQGIVHRDVKPHNVMIDAEGDAVLEFRRKTHRLANMAKLVS